MVTCSFKNLYGTAITVDGYNLEIYAGGNVMAVFTYRVKKSRNLVMFIADVKHLNNMTKANDFKEIFKKVTIYNTLPHFDKIATAIAKNGVEVTIKNPPSKNPS